MTPRNVCFQDGKVTYLDYFGRGLAVYDRQEQRCLISGTEHDLVHEIAYLFVLSTVGQYLDSQRMHRIHALGVSYRDCGVLLLLPSGGGKSTMALELLHQPGFLLLSEDTPLIDRRGWMLPFPLRLGVRPEQQPEIPSQYLRTVRRMEFDPKTLIDVEYFADRVGHAVPPRVLLIGERNLGDVSKIVPFAAHRAFKSVVKDLVVGIGIYQGMEFLLERGLDFLDQTEVALTVLYPTAGLTCGFIRDPEWAVAVTRAYNNWLSDRYLKVNARLLGMALLPLQDPTEAVKELRRAVTQLRMVGAVLPGVGLKRPLGHADFDPIYAEAERLGCALAVHSGSSQGLGLDVLEKFAQVRLPRLRLTTRRREHKSLPYLLAS